MAEIKDIPLALTYDDVLLIPKRSHVKSRKDTSVKTKLSKRISLNIPIVSSNMDTVTEVNMSVAMAQLGGIGILHRFASIKEQVAMVRKVKRARMYKIDEPYAVPIDYTVTQALEEFNAYEVSNLVVYEKQGSRKLVGVLNRKRLQYGGTSRTVKEAMIPIEELVVSRNSDITLHEAGKIISTSLIPILPVLTTTDELLFLVTDKDVQQLSSTPDAALDSKGRLMVGAAIGVKSEDMDRARELVKAEVDCLVVDIAHGHSDLAIDITRLLKSDPITSQVDIIVGNICTAEGARDLIEAGADALKVGVGPGSICITRKVAGSGYPQLSALSEVYKIARRYNVPIIADGGVKLSGDIAKAIAAGADTVMLGNLLSGTDESPGIVITKEGRKVKIIRGMAGYGANISKEIRAGARKIEENDAFDLVPEGVEAVVPYRGPVKEIIKQLVGGLKSGISYCGASNLDDMKINAEFVRITSNGLVESGAHDVSKI